MAESAQDLAQEALNSRRYTLAAEIYEKYVSQHGPNFKTYIMLADAYAKGERLKEAVDTYSVAFRYIFDLRILIIPVARLCALR